MPKLEFFQNLEDEIICKKHGRMRRMKAPRFDVSSTPTMAASHGIREVMEYRIYLSLRATIDPERDREAREYASNIIGQAVFGDLLQEIREMRVWVFTEGIGDDVEERLSRLEQLCLGHDVPPLKSEAER